MLKKSNNNSGMSLIEVIVSMLVLSIAVVAVTMSFSAASKINMGSKQKQSVESLMENFLEYAEAGGTNYQGWFEVDAANYQTEQDFSDIAPISNVRVELLKNIGQGFNTYDVRVTTDRAPVEYEKDKLNNFSVIQFGGSSSNTVLIDASLAGNDGEVVPSGVCDYDEAAYDYFNSLHSAAVLQHNMIEEQKEVEVPGYTANKWHLVVTDEIPSIVDRELWLVVSTPTSDKMQLKAYLTYMLSETKTDTEVHQVHLPAGTSYTYQIPIFESDLYDWASNTNANADKLDQIYILYTKATEEEATHENNRGIDIRLWDAQLPSAKALSANIFLIYQENSPMSINEAILKDGLGERTTEAHTIKMSCKDLDGNDKSPVKAKVYCSGTVVLEASSDVTSMNSDITAKGEEVRIVTTTVEILEAGTDTVLASKKVTHLQ